MSDRERVLTRIRAALTDVPRDETISWSPDTDSDPEAAYTRGRTGDKSRLADLFASHCAEYRAQVTRISNEAGELVAIVEQICKRHDVTSLAIPPTLDTSWRPNGPQIWIDQPPLSLEQLDACDGALTGCALAIASTGTIVLDTGAQQGRRALTLVPDLHICIVRADQIVVGVPEAFESLREAVALRRPLTFISGPSATSDIELTRVEGVHGPRRLEVVIVNTTS
jgi:L-lactate dehydrogenase complex protein LldG